MKTHFEMMARRLGWQKTLRFGLLVTVLATMIMTPANTRAEGQNTFASEQVSGVTVVVPAWAPPYPYVQRVRYYYLPDIMVYYDVFLGKFVYWNGTYWVYTVVLPPSYAWYNLYTGYVVILDYHVKNPWYRHTYYVKTYPKNYHVGYYGPRSGSSGNSSQQLRGYNENAKEPVYAAVKSSRSVDQADAKRSTSTAKSKSPSTVKSRPGESKTTLDRKGESEVKRSAPQAAPQREPNMPQGTEGKRKDRDKPGNGPR